MRADGMRRCLADERGSGLMEALLALAIGIFIAAAAWAVYDAAERTYSAASKLEEAQYNARKGLDRMVSDFRLIGAFVGTTATNAPSMISSSSSTSITFLADVDGDTVTSAGAEATNTSAASGNSVVVSSATGFTAGERLYIANGSTQEIATISSISGSTLTLSSSLSQTFASGSIVRSIESVTWTYNSGSSTLTRTVGSSAAETIVSNVTAFSFTYYDSGGTSTTTTSAIREIEPSITVKYSDDTSKRTMKVRVRPISLGL